MQKPESSKHSYGKKASQKSPRRRRFPRESVPLPKPVLSATPIIDLTIHNIPHAAPAALPWALQPAKATRANIAGIAHIMSRMDWYCALTGHLLDRENVGESLNLALQQLEQKVFTLHKAILLYQIESVCSYYNPQGLVFVGNLANLDKWKGGHVKDAEKTYLIIGKSMTKLTHRSSRIGTSNSMKTWKSSLGIPAKLLGFHQSAGKNTNRRREIQVRQRSSRHQSSR
jgi:hypothetical protein